MDTISLILTLVLVAAAINFIVFAARNDYVKTIKIDKDFTVRYPRVFFWLCIVFFMLVLALAMNMVIWQSAPPLSIILVIALCAAGIPFLLISTVWKIKVLPEYIIYVSPVGVKKQIYYKDISGAVVTRSRVILNTTLKTYRFSSNVVYREYFLKRLHMNGVDIERL